MVWLFHMQIKAGRKWNKEGAGHFLVKQGEGGSFLFKAPPPLSLSLSPNFILLALIMRSSCLTGNLYSMCNSITFNQIQFSLTHTHTQVCICVRVFVCATWSRYCVLLPACQSCLATLHWMLIILPILLSSLAVECVPSVCVSACVCVLKCHCIVLLPLYCSPSLSPSRSVAFRVHCTLERTFREFIEYFLPRWTIRIVFAKCQKGVWHKLSNKMREREGERERQRSKRKLSTCVHYDQLSCKSRKGLNHREIGEGRRNEKE